MYENAHEEEEHELEGRSLDGDSELGWPIALRKGKQSCTQKLRYPMANLMDCHYIGEKYKAFISALHSSSIPSSYDEAKVLNHWQHVMDVEMDALINNKTWELVTLPRDKRPVGCKWVYTIKHNADQSLERYKVWLVAKGYTQSYGIDYGETFAPVAKLNTLRFLTALATSMDRVLLQFDVKNAFLHGDLCEEVYMQLPPGYYREERGMKVYKLKKALYQLKQSPRAWFGKFSCRMKELGHLQSNGDHTLFLKHHDGKVSILLVYVENIIITGNDEFGVSSLSSKLAKAVEIRPLGRLRYFLGIEVAYSPQGIFISQYKYILDLLKETKMSQCKGQLRLCEEEPPIDKGQFQRLDGKLIYLNHTRPDIAFSVGVLSRFMNSPRKSYLEAAYRVLAYLKGSVGHMLLFKRHGGTTVTMYTDADWGGSPIDRRSTTGYCAFLGGNLITWRSKKQAEISLSSVEVEYRALVKGISEAIWIRNILGELAFEQCRPTTVLCDSKAAIDIAHNLVLHNRTKHIELNKHWIREKINKRHVHVQHTQ